MLPQWNSNVIAEYLTCSSGYALSNSPAINTTA